MRVDGVCAVQRSRWENSIMVRDWCFCFHFSSQLHSILIHSGFGPNPKLVAKLYRAALLTSWRNSPIRIPHGLQSAPVGFTFFFFFGPTRECLLIVPSLIFNLLRHGPYCCWRLKVTELRFFSLSFAFFHFFHFGEATFSIQFTHRQPCEMFQNVKLMESLLKAPLPPRRS